jgi:hypothetical protein
MPGLKFTGGNDNCPVVFLTFVNPMGHNMLKAGLITQTGNKRL